MTINLAEFSIVRLRKKTCTVEIYFKFWSFLKSFNQRKLNTF